MPDLPYAIYDADNHYYEPDDCFTRHIEAKYARRTVWLDRRGDESRHETRLAGVVDPA